MTITYYVRPLCLDRQLYLRPQFVLHREHNLNYNTPIAAIYVGHTKSNEQQFFVN
jgi:hypothetical protein